jgi:hypothetical protein
MRKGLELIAALWLGWATLGLALGAPARGRLGACAGGAFVVLSIVGIAVILGKGPPDE